MNISITRYRFYIAFCVAFLTIAAVLVLIFQPLNKSTEITGGFVLNININQKDSLDDIKNSLSFINDIKYTIVSQSNVTIKVPYSNDINIENVENHINKSATILSTSMIAPVLTSSLIYKAFISVVFAVATIFIYIFVRFNVYYSIGIVATIFHDVLFSFAFIKVMDIEFDMTMVAALLTLIGYSINDSVIIYDKIRSHISSKGDFYYSIDDAINKTLPRTIGTSFTTILAISPMAFFTFGPIQNFAIVILFGVFIGTISSITVSSLILLPFKNQIINILKLQNR